MKYNACHKYTTSDREAWKVAGNFFERYEQTHFEFD